MKDKDFICVYVKPAIDVVLLLVSIVCLVFPITISTVLVLIFNDARFGLINLSLIITFPLMLIIKVKREEPKKERKNGTE